jgi:hypothetical protein
MRPTSTGYYWGPTDDAQTGEPCFVFQGINGTFRVMWIGDDQSYPLDDFTGAFLPITSPFERQSEELAHIISNC